MGASKVFLSSLVILVVFNFITFCLGLSSTFDILQNIPSLIATFLLFGGIVIVISIIPLLHVSDSIKWFMGTLFMASLLFSLNINAAGFPISAGFGLATNLMNLGTSDINNINCVQYYFFAFIGVIGFISGVIMMLGGSD